LLRREPSDGWRVDRDEREDGDQTDDAAEDAKSAETATSSRWRGRCS
jgi:hypothetical protein